LVSKKNPLLCGAGSGPLSIIRGARAVKRNDNAKVPGFERGALAILARKPPNSGERGFQVASVLAGGMLVRTVHKHESLLYVGVGKRFLEDLTAPFH
jgi:hypothetical protein